ncbi:hypothetical protein BU23DRAFT_554636 [Bimuria novae-zelandiae CBS 107.79]|uniref:RING-type domain-containing protein n=1 Tax=Bimuria novae-zelandiae CBS 107.79 TaxID=1447943 RepID=A0A6A5V7M5_9PLEO|nr:hypothetical protein BU23DRAFT_554636 [Bimuria novae-zelandiae CBS 107.79]
MTGHVADAQQTAAPIPAFVLFTTPIHLECLAPDSRTCPICSEPYIEPQNTRPSPEDNEEWAMRVDMSATNQGSMKCCRHIFGRRCLEKHIKSCGPWHNKCPLCRQKWWISEDPPRHSSLTQAITQRIRTGRVGRRAGGSTRGQNQSQRSTFIGQVLETFAVDEGNERINATVHEVEETLDLLYQSQAQRQGRNRLTLTLRSRN